MWLKAGKSVEETEKLLKSTMMMSKLGAMESAEATDYLTAVLNGFNKTAEESVDVVDKLVAVDNAASTSVAEMAEALKRTSNMAQEAGISFERVTAYIATISETTKKRASVIGESIRSMLARMENIKLGNLDEEGKNINDVETALKMVNIELRNTDGSFRDMSAVLDEVAGRWDSFSDVERRAIAQTMAGSKQYENILVLLNNYDRALELERIALDSTGLAQERYNTYLGSVEAAQEKFTATWEEFMMKFLESDMIKLFYDLGSSIAGFGVALMEIDNPLTDVKESIDILVPILILAVSQIIGMNQALILTSAKTFISSMFGIAGATSTAGTAAGTAAIGFNALGFAIGAVLLVLYTYNEQIEKTKKIGMEANVELWKKTQGGAKDSETAVKNFTKEVERTKKVIESTKKEGFFEFIGASMIDQQAIINQGFIETEKVIRDTAKSYEEYISKVNEAAKAADLIFDEKKGQFYKKLAGGQRDYVEGLQVMTRHEMAVAQGMYETDEALKNLKSSMDEFNSSTDNTNTKVKDLADTITGLQDKVNKPMDILMNVGVGGEFNFDDIGKLKEALGENYQKALYIEGGQLKINTQYVKEYVLAIIDGEIKAAKTTGQNTEMLRLYREEIVNTMNNLPALSDAQMKAMDNVLKATVSMLKQKLEAEKAALQQELSAVKSAYDQRRQAAQDAYNEEMRAIQKKKDAIQDELDAINDLIEAEKERLNRKRKTEEYKKSLKKEQGELSEIEMQIAALRFDTSAEGIAKRMQLEEEAAAIRENISAIEQERQEELVVEGLENLKKKAEEEAKVRLEGLELEEEAAEARYQSKLREIERKQAAEEAALQKRIADIEANLQQEGLLNKQALEMLQTDAQGTYEQLMEWNRIYGDGIGMELTRGWNDAMLAASDYFNFIRESQAGLMGGGDDILSRIPMRHNGIESGRGDGKKNNEILTMLTKDEIVFTPKQLDTLVKNLVAVPKSIDVPSFSNNIDSGSINVSMPITVTGTLDKTVVPSIEKIADKVIEKIVSIQRNRGIIRQTTFTSI